MLQQVSHPVAEVAVSKQRDELNEQLTTAKRVLGTEYDFSGFRAGWDIAATPQERLSLLQRYKREFASQVMPRLQVKLTPDQGNLSPELQTFKKDHQAIQREIKHTQKITDVVLGDAMESHSAASQGVSTVFG